MKEAKDRLSLSIEKARGNLEEALHELERLPSNDEDAVNFAAHALSNFLTVTGATVELLGMSLEDHPDPAVRRMLGNLRHSTDLMSHTIAELRKASVGRGDAILRTKVDLVMVAERFVEFYQLIADRKGIRCILEPRTDKPVAWTDPAMMAVVLENLLSNALKFSPPGKRVWIRLAVEADTVLCSVRDEGPGIGEEDQARLYKRGTQLSARPTGGEPSTGYGLAVSKEFADRLGGTISCESTLGEGTTFTLRLPRYQEHLHGPDAPKPE